MCEVILLGIFFLLMGLCGLAGNSKLGEAHKTDEERKRAKWQAKHPDGTDKDYEVHLAAIRFDSLEYENWRG